MYNELLKRHPALAACSADIKAAINALIACYVQGGKVLLCGNGGSAAACDHIVGELTKGFLKKRPLSREKKTTMKSANKKLDSTMLAKLQEGLPAISLPTMPALHTAFCNDVDAELVFAQSVLTFGKQGDVLIAISTSGDAKNVTAAVAVAKALGITVIGLTGACGGMLGEDADIAICVPEKETYKIQEFHLPICHCLCAAVEAHFFQE